MEVVDDVDVDAFRTQADEYLRDNFNADQLGDLRGHPGRSGVTPAGEVQTFRGPVPADKLGTTLIHEHVFVGHPELDLNLPHPEWREDDAIETAVAGFERLWDARGPDRRRPDGPRVSVATSPGSVAWPTGRACSWSPRRATTRPTCCRRTSSTHGPGRLVGGPDPLLELFLRDIEEGIAGTERPGGHAQGRHGRAGPHARRTPGHGGRSDRAAAYRCARSPPTPTRRLATDVTSSASSSSAESAPTGS